MRLIAFVEHSAIVMGIVGIVAGQFFYLPKGLHLGVFLIGAGIALGGLESVATRRVGFRLSEDAYEGFAGAPAVIVGLMALLVGAAFIAAAYLLAEAQWHATLHYLQRRPGAVLVAAGLLVGGTGVLMMRSLLGSLLGLVVLCAGLAATALGVWEYFEPQAFDRLVEKLQRSLR